MRITALQFEQDSVGRRVKASKKKFTWHFAIDDEVHKVELYISFMTNKRKMYADGYVVAVQSHYNTALDFEFLVDPAKCKLIFLNDRYDLVVDGQKFSELYENLDKPEEVRKEEPVPQTQVSNTTRPEEKKAATKSWASGIEERPVSDVKGLGFEEWDTAYQKIQQVKPTVQPVPPVQQSAAYTEDLLSFDEIPVKKAEPKPTLIPAPQVHPAMMNWMAQMQQMQQSMKYPFMTQSPYYRY